ncbi:MAG TPA: oligosaccharide flippase family protein [Clostridia bacterium]|nr:oligosaccharide flippase family protein [Clostridia bacterium]
MLADKTESTPAKEGEHRSFFRQSGWLMATNIAGGALMWAVHFLSKKIPAGEYGNFGAFLAVVMVLPTIPLQMVMAQQTARALAQNRRGQLSGVIRLFAWGTLLVWAVGAVAVLVFQDQILTLWKVASPTALYLTLVIVLLSLWSPLTLGLLQGQQNFLWLGWTMMSNAVGRFVVAAFAVLVLHAYAAGMLTGVLIGIVVGLGIGMWHTRRLWLTPPEPFDRRALREQLLPLVLGFLGFQILFTADTMFVKAYFDEATAGFYIGAGTLSRALMWLVLPLAAVMFPRMVHSAAKSEKSNLTSLVLAGTAILAIMGAGGLTIVGPWAVPFVFKPSFVDVATPLLPWYAGAMVPLAVANVMLNDLLARPSSKLGFSICVFGLALLYMFALTQFHATLVTVPRVMGVFNLVFLGICAWFTWAGKKGPETLSA